ncbi:MAG: ABC transporter ATP-binding protein [Proteobacteria bacterium]|nr:ABC transporter ATP-binding protein [Pseudomonadota bacterium]
MIVADKVSYEFPRVRALSDVSFTLDAGSIAALIGPNGAGKTTLLRCLAALDRPYSGSIHIDGLDTSAQPRKVHQRIGYLSDFFGLYNDLTVDQCLRHAALAGGVPANQAADAVTLTAERLGLTERLADHAGTLSRGLKQRLGIAQAIIHKPKVLLLDEPASGLDPEARHSLSLLFRKLRDEGMTLLVSSHILSELEDYATEVLFIRDGAIVQQAPVQSETTETVRIRIEIAETVEDLADIIAPIAGVSVDEFAEMYVLVTCDAAPEVRKTLLESLVAAGVPVSGFSVVRERLQDFYLNFVEQADRGGGS